MHSVLNVYSGLWVRLSLVVFCFWLCSNHLVFGLFVSGVVVAPSLGPGASLGGMRDRGGTGGSPSAFSGFDNLGEIPLCLASRVFGVFIEFLYHLVGRRVNDSLVSHNHLHQPYNAVLSFHQLVENADECFLRWRHR